MDCIQLGVRVARAFDCHKYIKDMEVPVVLQCSQ